MDMIYVKPAEGGRVRQPERQYRVMPEEGAWVPRDAHYERLLATGDVIAADAPTKAAPDAETPAPTVKPETQSNPTSARGRRASGVTEE